MRKKEIERKSILGMDGPSNAISSITRPGSCPTERRRQWRTAPIKKTSFPFLLALSLSLDAAGGGGGGASKGCEQRERERGGGGEEYRCVAEEEGGREGGRSGGSAEAHRGWDKRGYRSYRRFYVTNQS